MIHPSKFSKRQNIIVNLGFTYQIKKDGDIIINRNGKYAITLRGKKALEFIENISTSEPGDSQLYMARITGNYKRGNERNARNHPRNR